MKSENIDFEFNGNNHLTNVIVRLGDINKPVKQAIGAHYDKTANSTGINDNALAVCLLIGLIKRLEDNLIEPLEVVFFDKEEQGMQGSNYYGLKRKNLDHVLVLDIIGYGNVPLICSPQMDIIDLNLNVLINNLPSDNYSLNHNNIKSSLIVTLPEVDLIKENNHYRLAEKLTFPQGMHGGIYDDIKYINWNSVATIYNSLYEYFKKTFKFRS